MIDRQTAVRALRDAAKDPSAFSTEELQMLMEVAEAPNAPKEPTSLLGPTGMDMLEQRIPVAPEAADIAAMIETYPGAQRALGGKLTDFTSGNPLTQNVEAYDASHNRALPNASKRPEFTAPPEYFHPAPEATEATTPMEAFGLKLDNARSRLPGIMGGKVDHYLEPSLEQFQRDMGQYVHPDEMAQGVESDAYKEYSDDLWQKIYETAKAEGRSVVRDAYKTDKSWTTRAGDAVAKQVAGAAAGVDRTFGGLFSRGANLLSTGTNENMQRLRESAPVAAFAGEAGAALLPFAPGSIAARGVSAALPKATGLLGTAARGGAVGAAAGGAQAAVSGDDIGGGVMFGAPLGALAGALGRGAQAHGENLRSTTTLGQAEKAGVAKTSALFGVTPTKTAKNIRAESFLQSGEPGRDVDMLAQTIADDVGPRGSNVSAALQRRIADTKSEYFALTKDIEAPSAPYVKEAMRLHSTGFTRDGLALPHHQEQSSFLRDAIRKSTSAEIVPSSGGAAHVRPTKAGAFDLAPEDAIKQGIDVETAMEGYLKAGGAAPGDYVVRVTPRPWNPEETESVIAKLGDYLDQGDAEKKRALVSLMPFARQVRDKFPALGPIPKDLTARMGDKELTGWSAFIHNAYDETASLQKTLEDAGLSSKVPDKLGSDPAKELFGAIRGYGQPGRSPDLDTALRALADPKKLEEMRGMANLSKLEGQASIFPSAFARGSGISSSVQLPAARFHLDPLLEAIAPPMQSGRLGAVGGMLDRKKKKPPEQLDPITLDQLKAFFGPGR